MKKILLMIIAAGFIVSGCAKREVIKPAAQLKQETPAATQNQKTGSQAEKQTPKETEKQIAAIPVEKITSSDAAEKEKAAMSKAMKALQARLKDVHFDYDKYQIKSEDISIIKEAAAALKQNQSVKVTIEGYCDDRGTNEYNLALGDKRASFVKDYLRSLGISSQKMDTISYGEEKSLCTESTEECWAKNRRAHFALSGL